MIQIAPARAAMVRPLWVLLVLAVPVLLATLQQVEAQQRAVVLGRFNMFPWNVRAFPDTFAMWIWSRKNANNAPTGYTTFSKNLIIPSTDTAILSAITDALCTVAVNGVIVDDITPITWFSRPGSFAVVTFPLERSTISLSLRCDTSGVSSARSAGILFSIRSALTGKVLARSDATWTCSESSVTVCNSYPGYIVTPDKDVSSNSRSGFSGTGDGAFHACNANPSCKAFDSAGWLKFSTAPKTFARGNCFYTKAPLNPAAPVSAAYPCNSISWASEDFCQVDPDAKVMWSFMNALYVAPSSRITTFYKTVTVGSNVTAYIFALVDNFCGIYVQGIFVRQVAFEDVLSGAILPLQRGDNVIALVCRNMLTRLDTANPASVILSIKDSNGNVLARSDGSWTYTQEIGSPVDSDDSARSVFGFNQSEAFINDFPDAAAYCIWARNPSVETGLVGQTVTMFKEYIFANDAMVTLYALTNKAKCYVYLNGDEIGSLNPLRFTHLYFKAGVNLLQLRCTAMPVNGPSGPGSPSLPSGLAQGLGSSSVSLGLARGPGSPPPPAGSAPGLGPGSSPSPRPAPGPGSSQSPGPAPGPGSSTISVKSPCIIATLLYKDEIPQVYFDRTDLSWKASEVFGVY